MRRRAPSPVRSTRQRARPAPALAAFAATSPQRPARLGDQLYEQILEQIVVGKLPEGSRLPSESQLCAAFGVSRPVVREALSRLQADGVVVSRHGSGSFVQRRPNQDLLRLAPIGSIADLMRCFEVRIALEGEVAHLAASRRTEDDLQAIKAALEELDGVIARGEVGSEADIRFHKAIAVASKNKLFVATLETLATHVFQGMTVARNLSLKRSQARLQLVQEEHIAIYEAIKREDPEAARATMRAHIDNARTRVLSDSTEP
jgi:DNA-binding FadR family transcriptional regulator